MKSQRNLDEAKAFDEAAFRDLIEQGLARGWIQSPSLAMPVRDYFSSTLPPIKRTPSTRKGKRR